MRHGASARHSVTLDHCLAICGARPPQSEAMTEQKTPKGRLAAMVAIAIVVALIWFFDFLTGLRP